MQNYIDPDTKCIKEQCKTLIGAKIKFMCELEYSNGSLINMDMNDCNIVGNCIETLIIPLLKRKIETIKEGPAQAPPDFINKKKYCWEVKAFCKSPNFDISNYMSFIEQLQYKFEEKVFLTQYLIFKYTIHKNYISIDDFEISFIWDIISYDGKYPISVQNKKGIWYNIRTSNLLNT